MTGYDPTADSVDAAGGAGGSRASVDPRYAGIRVVLILVAIMWAAEVVDTIANHRLDRLGIEPRSLDGLLGIVFAPFLHASFGHLIGNTIPFVLLGGAIALSGVRQITLVTVIVAVTSGMGAWLFGHGDSLIIGASGLVFGYAAYLIVRGVYTRRVLHLGTGVLVIVIYGASLLFSLIPKAGVSWQGHLFGAVGGVLAAWMLDRRPRA